MSNERTIIYPPCPNGWWVPCFCVACAPETIRLLRAEAAARAPECEARTATQYLAREQAERDALRAIVALDDELAARLRAFLKDCGCPCCNARYRLRTLSYERACESPASIHCASTDGRDHLKDPGPCESALLEVLRAAAAADAARRPEDIQALRAAPKEYHETDTDAR